MPEYELGWLPRRPLPLERRTIIAREWARAYHSRKEKSKDVDMVPAFISAALNPSVPKSKQRSDYCHMQGINSKEHKTDCANCEPDLAA